MNNFEKYFGTPERTAETIDDITAHCNGGDSLCKQCPLCGNCDYELDILKWLKTEVFNE